MNTEPENNRPVEPPMDPTATQPTVTYQHPNLPVKPFPIVKLLITFFVPLLLLILVVILQLVSRMVLSRSGSTGNIFAKLINIFSLLLGMAGVMGMLIMPLVIILIIVNYNKHKNSVI